VQATWLGYPSGTGLPELTLRIVDAETDPPQAHAAADGGTLADGERLVRMEGCSVCYGPPADAPAPGASADAAERPFTFGAFNALAKLDDDSVSLWAGVLRSAPQSRLLIRNAGLRSQAVRAFTRGRFERAGVEPSRVIVEPPVADPRDVLASYSRVDAALDSVPYNGTTTTCEALLMGVPVLTVAGATTASRMGVSLLSHAGLPEWILPDSAAFARLGADLAARGPRTTADRAALRARFLASPLCDARGFASRFGNAIRSIWTDARH
jgi:predicted O-linked N-acetylglucosamine transferase (SPINDLY family)